EKLSVDQISAAFRQSVQEQKAPIVQLQLIPSISDARYELLLEAESCSEDTIIRFASAFDRHLCKRNQEYDQKRRSERLLPFRLWLMRRGWSADRQKFDIVNGGKRDTQYKWPVILYEWDDRTRDYVDRNLTVADTNPSTTFLPPTA